MNNKRMGNLLRSIAFFLTGTILVCTFGFTVDGWTIDDDSVAPPVLDDTTSSSDGNEDLSTDKTEPPTEEIYIPEFVNRLTGLETTKELSEEAHIAFVLDGDLPFYGIYGSDITIEIPIEDSKTRMICIKNNISDLWKIGSITYTRDYISNISAFFDCLLVCNDNDDIIDYSSCFEEQFCHDLSVKKGYNFVEDGSIYTNADLLNALIGKRTSTQNSNTLPFCFTGFDEEPIKGYTSAKKITIPYCDDKFTELVFSEETNTYFLTKNDTVVTDPINGNSPEYTNCLILSTDSITYDTSNGTQMIMNTIGTGSGFYITEGSFSPIKWISTEAGILTFYTDTGEKLTINRGTTYISYVKASIFDKITIL